MESFAQPQFKVVANAEGQYSLWPLHKREPEGWADAGVAGSREECLSRVGALWTDMRPRSVRSQE